jgi:mRNA interferase MazF
VVLSNRKFNKRTHSILAMITTKREPAWPGDSPIVNFSAAGLRLPCLVRFKLFTLDNRLLHKKLGRLNKEDAQNLARRLERIFL